MAGHCRDERAGSHPSPAGRAAWGTEQADMTPVGDASWGSPMTPSSGWCLSPFVPDYLGTKPVSSFWESFLCETQYFLKEIHFLPPFSLHVPIIHRDKQLFFAQWSNNILQMPIRGLHPHLVGELSCACSVCEPVLQPRPATLSCNCAFASSKWLLI